jgi:hypothetical protein
LEVACGWISQLFNQVTAQSKFDEWARMRGKGKLKERKSSKLDDIESEPEQEPSDVQEENAFFVELLSGREYRKKVPKKRGKTIIESRKFADNAECLGLLILFYAKSQCSGFLAQLGL